MQSKIEATRYASVFSKRKPRSASKLKLAIMQRQDMRHAAGTYCTSQRSKLHLLAQRVCSHNRYICRDECCKRRNSSSSQHSSLCAPCGHSPQRVRSGTVTLGGNCRWADWGRCTMRRGDAAFSFLERHRQAFLLVVELDRLIQQPLREPGIVQLLLAATQAALLVNNEAPNLRLDVAQALDQCEWSSGKRAHAKGQGTHVVGAADAAP